MVSINRVTLVGNLGRDPETKFITSGKQVCNASIATEKSWKSGDTWEKRTTWHRIIGWGKTAELLAQANKGDTILVDGELVQRSWEDKEGKKQFVTEVLASTVAIIQRESKKESHGDTGAPPDDEVPF